MANEQTGHQAHRPEINAPRVHANPPKLMKTESGQVIVDEAKVKARAEKKEARNKAIAILREHAAKLDANSPVKAALFMVIGTGVRKSSSVSRTTVNIDLRDAFLEKKSLDEMEIFKRFKIGRPEMTTKIRILVLCKNPADRVWVKFDEDAGVYNVVGTGEKPPKDWDGYLPPEESEL